MKHYTALKKIKQMLNNYESLMAHGLGENYGIILLATGKTNAIFFFNSLDRHLMENFSNANQSRNK